MFPGLNTKFNDFKCHIKIQDFFHTFPNFLLVGETGAFRTVKGGGGGGGRVGDTVMQLPILFSLTILS